MSEPARTALRTELHAYTHAGHSGRGYGVESTRAETLAGQDRLFDVGLFNQWLNATYRHETALARAYEKRFRLEFRPAFEAWLATVLLFITLAPRFEWTAIQIVIFSIALLMLLLGLYRLVTFPVY